MQANRRLAGPGSRVAIMPDRGGVAEALTERLQTLGVEVVRLDRGADVWTIGPVQGVYWLPALDDEGDLNNMTWPPGTKLCRCGSSRSTRPCALSTNRLRQPGTFLVSATRLGGQHGYDEAGAIAPLGGAVTGFTKAYKRERPDALVKAVDFEAGRAAAEIAELLIDETLRDPGAIEIGYQGEQRWTIGLEEQPAADGQPGMTLDSRYRVPGHRRGRQHRLRHHRRPGGGLGRHVLPARSGAGARPRQSRPEALRHR